MNSGFVASYEYVMFGKIFRIVKPKEKEK